MYLMLPAKPYPCNDEETTLIFALENHPEAENEIEAVDLFAQDIYKKIRNDREIKKVDVKDQYDDIEFYGYLKGLRVRLLEKAIKNESSYQRKEAVNG